MRLLASAVFAALLLLGAAGLMVWHVRSWRAQQRRKLEPEEREFFHHQFRRRMQTSAILAVVAVMLPLGLWIVETAIDDPDVAWPRWALASWILVNLLLLSWVAMLALADLWSSRLFFSRLKQRYFLEKTRLEAELRRIHGAGGNGNGKAAGAPRRKGPETREQGPES